MNEKSDEVWKQWHLPLLIDYNSRKPQRKRIQHRIFHAVLVARFPERAAGKAGNSIND
ncbi:hypothetical protein B4098_2297 [Heyndrickxia coagulans]|uniref:Uncharacterized protein n=1 Tax=Heyndrickxia coagulans TaxID=1398 RepID=A0A150KBV1_HEYCO|nr:hypothetical protein B4098_2297 [Heyndrickxia coagulans]